MPSIGVEIQQEGSTTIEINPSLTIVEGPPGPQGPQGTPGIDGVNGTNGTNGSPGAASVLTRTSTTSNTIGITILTFSYPTTSNLGWTVGMRLRATNSLSTWVEGSIFSVSSTSVSIDVDSTKGSGTFSSWSIGIMGEKGEKGDTGAAGSGGMVNPMTSAGDLIIGGSSGTPTRLAKGADGKVLKMASGAITWGDDSGGGGGGSLPAGGTTGQVLTKNSAADGDAGWATPSGGGGSSVNRNFILNPFFKAHYSLGADYAYPTIVVDDYWVPVLRDWIASNTDGSISCTVSPDPDGPYLSTSDALSTDETEILTFMDTKTVFPIDDMYNATDVDWDGTMTLSFKIYTSSATSVYAGVQSFGYDIKGTTTSVSGSGVVSVTFSLYDDVSSSDGDGGASPIKLRLVIKGNGKVWLEKAKLEFGSVSTISEHDFDYSYGENSAALDNKHAIYPFYLNNQDDATSRSITEFVSPNIDLHFFDNAFSYITVKTNDNFSLSPLSVNTNRKSFTVSGSPLDADGGSVFGYVHFFRYL